MFRSVNEPRIPLIITSDSVVLNTALGLMLVLGLGPIPSLGVAGAGLATLISQSGRCLALITVLYFSNKNVRWIWPRPNSKTAVTATKLIRLTGPIAASEVLLGNEHLPLRDGLYALGHQRAGCQPDRAFRWRAFSSSHRRVWRRAAVAVIGHALGIGSLQAAKANAWLTVRFGLIAAVVLGALYTASGFLLRSSIPRWGRICSDKHSGGCF